MTTAPPAGAPAQAPVEQGLIVEQALIEEAYAHARRRRRKNALAVIAVAAAAGGLALAGARAGGGPASHVGPGQPGSPAAVTVRTGSVTGYIEPCDGSGVPMPHPAGTVTALRGVITSVRVGGNGTYSTYRDVFPSAVAARQYVGQNRRFRFDLAPGRYVLEASYDGESVMSFLQVSVWAGRVLHRDLPDLCR